MTTENLTAATTIAAPAEDVFAVLTDPTNHAAIDGTGWVQESLDGEHLRREGQIFRMAMYHANHPDGRYEMANAVRVFEAPRAISWEPGQDPGTGTPEFGGWVWRYELTPVGADETTVTLTYDWSAVPPFLREHITFPPFAPEHLDNSLSHLAEMAHARRHGITPSLLA
jgi:uncharacterized protein YndB with AHSA1/START domain